jgi:hypothetical protein
MHELPSLKNVFGKNMTRKCLLARLYNEKYNLSSLRCAHSTTAVPRGLRFFFACLGQPAQDG